MYSLRSSGFIDYIPPQLGGITRKNSGVATRDGLVAELDEDTSRHMRASHFLALISGWHVRFPTGRCRIISTPTVLALGEERNVSPGTRPSSSSSSRRLAGRRHIPYASTWLISL